MNNIGRLLTAMVTPFDQEGNVDFQRASELSKALVKTGSDGLLLGGTTGESPTLSYDEKLQLFSVVKESVGSEIAVIAGTTDNNTQVSLELSKDAEKLGVDGLLLTVPAYNKPTQEGLFKHFEKIANSVKIPCILYNVPSRTSLNMDSSTTLKLSSIENIIGIKEASSDLDQVTEIISNAPEGFKVWSGNDNETFLIMALGGYGVVSVASNIIGNQVKSMIGLILEGEIEQASSLHKKLLPLFNALFWVTNPIPIKYALNKKGFPVGDLRLPMVMPDEISDSGVKLDEILDNYHIDVSEDY
ncbi:MAG: 4-hydroxy-tetrahydrodipicolinate synthase [Chloroflexi bacterium]|nr:4-hydroxy-tetrahydrodipicolinate synthase [Chloroflexota bacterium]